MILDRGHWVSGSWLFAVATLCLGTACDRSPPPTSTSALLNASYLSEWAEEGVVTLTEGEYRAAAAPGSASEVLVAFADLATGDLDGDGDEDAAVVLVERSSGAGIFYRLHALLSDGRETRDVSSRFLGDRIAFQAVRIEDGVIETDFLVQRPDEPAAARPSVPITTGFVLTNRGLLPAEFPSQGRMKAAGSPEDSTQPLTDAAWRIVSIRTGDDSAVAADTTGDLPELAFAEELRDVDGSSGRLFGSTGCNRLLGSYQASNAGGLRISGIATTRRMCDGARMEFEQLLTLSLGSATGFEGQGDELEIRFAGGTIRLMRLPDSRPQGDLDATEP